jgi:hypothetical protein
MGRRAGSKLAEVRECLRHECVVILAAALLQDGPRVTAGRISQLVRAVCCGLIDDLRYDKWVGSIRHHGLHGGPHTFNRLLVLGQRLVVAKGKRSRSKVSFDRARLYDLHLHADGLHLVGQRLADALDRELGAVIQRTKREKSW